MNLAFLLTFIFLILIFLYDVLKKRNSGNFKSKFLIIIIILLFLFELYNRLGEPKTEHFLSGGVREKLKYSIIEPQEYTAKPEPKLIGTGTGIGTGNNDNSQSTKNIFSIIYDYNPFSVSYGDYNLGKKLFIIGNIADNITNNSRKIDIYASGDNNKNKYEKAIEMGDEYKELSDKYKMEKNNKYRSSIVKLEVPDRDGKNKKLLNNDGTSYKLKDSYTFIAGGCNIFPPPVEVIESVSEATKSNYKDNLLSDEIEIYDHKWDVWKKCKFKSREYKYNISSIVYQGVISDIKQHNKVLFVGGCFYSADNKDTLRYSNTIDIYDYSKGDIENENAWSVKKIPTKGRCNIHLGIYNDKLLMCGGFNEDGYYNKMDIYDFNKDEFSEVELPINILYENLVLLPLRNKVFLMSGELSDQTVSYDTGMRRFIQNGKIYNFDADNNEFNLNQVNSEAYDDSNTKGYNKNETMELNNYLDEYLYNELIKEDYKDSTISLTLRLEKLNESRKWLLGKSVVLRDDKTNLFPGLIIENNKIYPVVCSSSKVMMYTSGIEVKDGETLNISLSLNNDGIGKIYKNFNKQEAFDFKFELTFTTIDTLGLTTTSTKIDIEESKKFDYFNEGVLLMGKLYDSALTDVTIQNNFMTSYGKFDSEYRNLCKRNNDSKIYYYTGNGANKFEPFTEYKPLINKQYNNIIGNTCVNNLTKSYGGSDRYAVIFAYDIEKYQADSEFQIQKYVFIYDEYNNTWTYDEFIADYSGNNTYHINSMTTKINKGNDLIFGGLVSVESDSGSKRVHSKFEIFHIQPDGFFEYTDNDDIKCKYLKNCKEEIITEPIYCPPGMKKLPDDIINPRNAKDKQKQREYLLSHNIQGKCPLCVPCDMDTYSDELNKEDECKPCEGNKSTHNKVGQTKCFPKDFYDKIKKVPISDNTQLEIVDKMQNYMKQKSEMNKIEKQIYGLNGKLQDILSNNRI